MILDHQAIKRRRETAIDVKFRALPIVVVASARSYRETNAYYYYYYYYSTVRYPVFVSPPVCVSRAYSLSIVCLYSGPPITYADHQTIYFLAISESIYGWLSFPSALVINLHWISFIGGGVLYHFASPSCGRHRTVS